jgi:hypothetical protein
LRFMRNASWQRFSFKRCSDSRALNARMSYLNCRRAEKRCA